MCGGADFHERTHVPQMYDGRNEQSIRDVALIQTNTPYQSKVPESRIWGQWWRIARITRV
jgi:hypothetical protein